MNLGSHLCAVIELNLEPGHQTQVCRFSEPLLEFLGVMRIHKILSLTTERILTAVALGTL